MWRLTHAAYATRMRRRSPRLYVWFSGDTTSINMGDYDGVNLAGVQALERRTAELREQVAERDRRIESLEERVARLEALVAAQAQRQP